MSQKFARILQEHITQMERLQELPTPVFQAISTAIQSRSEAQLLQNLCEVTERVAHRLASLLNSLYLYRDGTGTGLQGARPTRKGANATFGTQICAIREYARLLSNDPILPALSGLVEESFPIEIGVFVKVWALCKEAGEFRVGPRGLALYLARKLQSPVRDGDLGSFLDAVINLRNIHAHQEDPKNQWWPKHDPDCEAWFAAINNYLMQGTARLVTHPTLFGVLREYPTFEAGPVLLPGSEDGARMAYTLGRLDTPRNQLAPWTRVVSGTALTPGTSYVGRWTDESRTSLEPLFAFYDFPSIGLTPEQKRQKYAFEYLKTLLGDGVVNPDEQKSLCQFREYIGLKPEEALAAVSEVEGLLDELPEDPGTPIPPERSGRFEKVLGMDAQQFGELAVGLRQIGSKREQVVREFLSKLQAEDQSYASLHRIVGETLLSEQQVESIVDRLRSGGTPIRLVSGQKGLAVEKIYRIHDPVLVQTLDDALTGFETSLREGRPFPDSERTLLGIACVLASDEIDQHLRCRYEELTRLTQVAAPAANLVLTLDGQPVEGASLRQLLSVLEPCIRAVPDLDGHLPFKVGRTRTLVARADEAPDDANFSGPVDLGSGKQAIRFETVWENPQAGLFHLVRFLKALGIEAGIPGVDDSLLSLKELPPPVVQPRTEEDGEADEGDEVRIGEMSCIFLDEVEGREVERRFRGATVPRLYQQVLCHLVESGALDGIPLPIGFGRVRNLISDTPFHSKGFFVSPIIYKGLYMETHCSRYRAGENLSSLLALVNAFSSGRLARRPRIDAGLEGKKSRQEKALEVLRIGIAGKEISGTSIRNFLENAISHLRARGLLLDEALPVMQGSVAKLVTWTGDDVHLNKVRFSSPHEFDDPLGRGRLVAEASQTFVSAVAGIRTALRRLGIQETPLEGDIRTTGDVEVSALEPGIP